MAKGNGGREQGEILTTLKYLKEEQLELKEEFHKLNELIRTHFEHAEGFKGVTRWMLGALVAWLMLLTGIIVKISIK